MIIVHNMIMIRMLIEKKGTSMRILTTMNISDTSGLEDIADMTHQDTEVGTLTLTSLIMMKDHILVLIGTATGSYLRLLKLSEILSICAICTVPRTYLTGQRAALLETILILVIELTMVVTCMVARTSNSIAIVGTKCSKTLRLKKLCVIPKISNLISTFECH